MSAEIADRTGNGPTSSGPQAPQLLGWSGTMRNVHHLIEAVSDTDVTVLIRGECGTGKDLVARAIHESSARRHKTFVKVNCAALPAELLESELFGCERGAFPGAIQQKPGKLEFAHEGTMFLDAISDVDPRLQAKLLQLLQDGGFARLGGRRELQVNVRIIAATNCDLECAVAEGQFREDLYFRLNIVSITLPPLRQRRDEIPLLADRFLKHYTVRYNRPCVGLSEETLRLFDEYSWPGNVRELKELMKRAVVSGSDDSIREELRNALSDGRVSASPIPALQPRRAGPQDAATPATTFPPPITSLPPTEVPVATGSLKAIARSAAREAERELIYRTLQQTRWNRREAAEILGVSYKALLYKIKEAELDKAS